MTEHNARAGGEVEVNAQLKENGDVVMYYFGKRVRIKAGVMKYMTLKEETTYG
jgi:hypothetical protein